MTMTSHPPHPRRNWRTPLAAGAAALIISGSLAAAPMARAEAPAAPPTGTSIVDILGKGGNGGGYLTAPDGRQVVLQGLNTQGSVKLAPDCMPAYTEQEIATERRELGSNAVRLMMQWRCVEPEPGRYDEAYLDRIQALVRTYNRYGMTVLLDMHQDLYGPGITPARDVGNGAPVWATHTDGLPVPKQPDWTRYYLTPGVMRAFDNFWNRFDNHPELREHYAAMWAKVAQRFAGEPGVVGYDLMNEPFGASLLPNQLDQGPLAELYRRTVAKIREVDSDTWIFLEASALGTNQGLPSSLPRIADPRPGPPKIGYAPHLYILGTEHGGMPAGSALAVKAGIDIWQANVRKQAKALSPDGTTVPLLIGEYGLDTTKSGAIGYLDHARYRFGQMSASTFYYSSDRNEWGPYAPDGSRRNTADVLSRCFAPVVAGVQEYQTSDNTGCWIKLVSSTGGDTLVTAPGVTSADQVQVTGATVVRVDPQTNTLVLRAPESSGATEIAVRFVER